MNHYITINYRVNIIIVCILCDIVCVSGAAGKHFCVSTAATGQDDDDDESDVFLLHNKS